MSKVWGPRLSFKSTDLVVRPSLLRKIRLTLQFSCSSQLHHHRTAPQPVGRTYDRWNRDLIVIPPSPLLNIFCWPPLKKSLPLDRCFLPQPQLCLFVQIAMLLKYFLFKCASTLCVFGFRKCAAVCFHHQSPHVPTTGSCSWRIFEWPSMSRRMLLVRLKLSILWRFSALLNGCRFVLLDCI